jgi:class 3 adenylate cyclase/Tfp pilus assembly protein PilF
MKKATFLFLMMTSGLSLIAQDKLSDGQTRMDSLQAIWQDDTRADSLRVQAYKTYIWDGYLFSNPDSALVLAEAMYGFSEKHAYPIAANQAYTLQAIAYDMKGDFTLAMEYAERSIAGNEKIGNKIGISEAEIVVGVLFEEQADFSRALQHYNKALRIDEEIGNKEGMAMSLNNIGNIYMTQDNSLQALEHYQRALAIDEELGVKQGIAIELLNIADIYVEQGDIAKALEYHKRALDLNSEIGDKYGVASTLTGMASIFELQGEASLALEYHENALTILEELGMQQQIAYAQVNIGYFYLDQGERRLALTYCQKALSIAEEIGALSANRKACDCLYLAHRGLGNLDKALDYFEKMIDLRDSINSEETARELTRIQMQYEFDKKEAATLAEQEKKDAVARQRLQRQKVVRNSFIGGFAVVLLFAGVFFVQRNRIGKEKERSEELLLNILPEETAQELKEKGHSDAQLIDQVTVLFTDFKGFTALSEQLSPKELVKDLHDCFSAFDRICEKHGIEKIKTIGDAYMAAGGLPTPNSTHAQDVVNAAMEMSEFVEAGKRKKVESGLPFFEIRIGVHTGPVVAGIVGIKKFQYDIWGDTVNTASRMESSGEVGKVNLSQSTYEIVKDQYTCEYRGEIEAKGKGKLGMYFVSSKAQKA